MLQNNVSTLFNQRFGGVCLFGWIKPCVGPNDVKLDIWIHSLGVNIGTVDPADHFGDRERSNITDFIGLGHFTRNMALDCTAFIKPGRINRYVFSTFVACGVLKFYVGEFFRHIDCRVHIAK